MRKVLCFDDVLLVPKHSTILSRKDVNLKQVLHGHTYNLKLEIPLISAPMDTVTEEDMAITLSKMGGLGIIHRYNSIEHQISMIKKVYAANAQCGVAIGATKDYMERFQACYNAGVRVFCIDIAHGDHVLMVEAIRSLRKTNLPMYLIVGNVANHEGALRLIDAGADCIRTSVGSGAACTTRIVTGFGIPTFQAVLDIATYTRNNYPVTNILADGGIRNSGDAIKCLVAGASLIMCGALLAGTSDSPGIPFSEKGKIYKRYRGMASRKAMIDLDKNKADVTPEGVEHFVSYTGKTVDVVNEFLGGIRSGLSYAGIDSIEKMYKSVEIVEISHAGLIESHAHIKL